MVAAIVVGDLRERGKLGGHPVEIGLRHGHGRQGEAPAKAFGVEQGAETAEDPAGQQAAEGRDEGRLVGTQFPGDRHEGALHQGETTLIVVDEAPFQVT